MYLQFRMKTKDLEAKVAAAASCHLRPATTVEMAVGCDIVNFNYISCWFHGLSCMMS